jgi:hypothetical protein
MTCYGWLAKTKEELWNRGWSMSFVGLWYRPFPRNHESGLTIFQAAKEIGLQEPPENYHG